MTHTKTELSADALTKIGGGECSAEDWIKVTTELTGAYEALIDFTSYVFSRVAGDPPAQP